jgi:uncharacterized GH25 family protein
MRRDVMMTAAVAILALGQAATCRAHDLRVFVSRLVAAPGDQDTVYISYGHVLPVDTPIDADWIQDYHVKTPSGSLLTLVKEGTSLHANTIHVEEQGLYQAVATQKPAVWTEVVDDKGNHTHVREPKATAKGGSVDHATLIKKYAKALVVSGSKTGSPAEVLGHELEIVPVEVPADWRSGRDLHFRVLYNGRPLPSGDLVATYLGFKPETAWCYATATDRQGVALVRPSQAGTWVIRVRTQKPAAKDKQAEYDVESISATLVLEIQP